MKWECCKMLKWRGKIKRWCEAANYIIKKDGCALVMIYAGRLCLYDFYDLNFFFVIMNSLQRMSSAVVQNCLESGV